MIATALLGLFFAAAAASFVLRFPACQRHKPSLGFERDRRFPTGTRAIVERGHRTFDHGALDAALDCLMVKPERPTNRKKRRILPIGQQYSRPLDPACRFGSRLRYRIHSAVSSFPSDNSIARRHAAMTSTPLHLGHTHLYRSPKTQMNPLVMTTFMESVV